MNWTDEWYDVEPVTETSYSIVEGREPALPVAQFLVSGTERAAVIDAGIGVGDLRGLVADMVDTPVTLLLTHCHWDHIGNASQFDDVRIHPDERTPDGRVTIDVLSEEFVDQPEMFVDDWREAGYAFPDGFTADQYSIEPVADPAPMEPGERIDLGDRHLEAVHTPGHSPGHQSMLDREEGILYGGDVIHGGTALLTQFRGGDLRSYRDTFERLIDLRDDGAFDTLLTGHNPPIAGDDLTMLDRFAEGIDRILDGAVEFEVVETEWGDTYHYEMDGLLVATSPTEV